MTINFYFGDCMDWMYDKPDGYYDLAVVDPPYGDGGGKFASANGGRFGERFKRYGEFTPPHTHTGLQQVRGLVEELQPVLTQRGGIHAKTGRLAAEKKGKFLGAPGADENKIEFWDNAPGEEYFQELFRVSKNQIIWGGNYFPLPPTRCFLVWRKLTISQAFSMAMVEYAWTSFNGNAKFFECAPQGTAREKRIHPTQKPVSLYVWQLEMFAKKGMKLLDTHGGSMSSAIAAHELGLDMDICEKEESYYMKGKERVERAMKQGMLFAGNIAEREEETPDMFGGEEC